MEGSPLSRASSAWSASSPHGVDPLSLRPPHTGCRWLPHYSIPPQAYRTRRPMLQCRFSAARPPPLPSRSGQRLVLLGGDYTFLPGGGALPAVLRFSQWLRPSTPTSNQWVPFPLSWIWWATVCMSLFILNSLISMSVSYSVCNRTTHLS